VKGEITQHYITVKREITQHYISTSKRKCAQLLSISTHFNKFNFQKLISKDVKEGSLGVKSRQV